MHNLQVLAKTGGSWQLDSFRRASNGTNQGRILRVFFFFLRVVYHY